MRLPFVVSGYQVTEENMSAVANWCQGHIFEDGPNSFIRVPVDRPTNKKQTEAYIGSHVLLSVKRNGEESFKVYTEEWLIKNFFEIPREMDEQGSVPDEVAQVEDHCCCNGRCKRDNNVRTLPVPRPPLARTPEQRLERVPPSPLVSPFRN
jgi:hypothetical protein